MNSRRQFFKQTLGLVAAAALAPLLPKVAAVAPAPVAAFTGPLTYKGIPLVFDKACAMSQMYFVNPRYHARLVEINALASE
jgi:anaerobic selenocysteine-containing dehydrogenase